ARWSSSSGFVPPPPSFLSFHASVGVGPCFIIPIRGSARLRCSPLPTAERNTGRLWEIGSVMHRRGSSRRTDGYTVFERDGEGIGGAARLKYPARAPTEDGDGGRAVASD
ncbi:hypothetical protein Mapa_017023, partial [Marchantia paleacea]